MDANKMSDEGNKNRRHYVLVHGACHGAWCWFKLKPQLQSAGNKVTVLDLAASGINPKRMEDVGSFAEYSEPLLEFLESLPLSEKVVLVGHIFGGFSLALAMDKFPHKIASAVFVAAFLPDTQHPPSYAMEQHIERNHVGGLETGRITFGSNFSYENAYQLCSSEDVELAKTLVRPGWLFREELRKAKNFSKEGFGSVPVAYVVCNEDLAIPMEFQKWMIQNAGVDEVIQINGADHMPMLSKPHQLCSALLHIGTKLASESEAVKLTMEAKHYVLVHGLCHGAWCWYKLKPLLECSGNKVTVLDLAASGINPKRMEDVGCFAEYSEPLLEFLESLPSTEKVVVVGHSFGGLSLALAMDKFPYKIELAVFLAAFVPDTQHPPSYVIEQQERAEPNEVLNLEISSSGSATTMIFSSKCLSTKIYQLSPIEDLELAKMLIRPGNLFVEELQKAQNFSGEGYGSVEKAYVACKEDAIIPLAYQKWMIQNAGIDHVLEIDGSDHMPMLSKPQQLCLSLLKISHKNNM